MLGSWLRNVTMLLNQFGYVLDVVLPFQSMPCGYWWQGMWHSLTWRKCLIKKFSTLSEKFFSAMECQKCTRSICRLVPTSLLQVGTLQSFNITVVVHQFSALSPLFFILYWCSNSWLTAPYHWLFLYVVDVGTCPQHLRYNSSHRLGRIGWLWMEHLNI